MTPVRVGDWTLEQLFLGQPADLERAEDGPTAPMTLRFAVADASETATGTGATGVTIRVQPDRYSVTDTAVHFEGRSPELGRVIFDGRLDQGALATARRNLGSDGVVLSGTLTAGGQTARDVRLAWWMGD